MLIPWGKQKQDIESKQLPKIEWCKGKLVILGMVVAFTIAKINL